MNMNERELRELEGDPAIVSAATLVHASLTNLSLPVRLRPGGPTLSAVWEKLRSEVHELLCMDSPKYKEERLLFQKTYKPAIAALTAYLTSGYGVPTASATALASLAVILPVKMVITSWCAAFEDTVSQAEVKALEDLGHGVVSG